MPNSMPLHDNLQMLDQAMELLEQIDDAAFTHTDALYPSGVGSHLRHCLDHYFSFLDGCCEGAIDYDQRARDPRLEQERTYACEALATLHQRLRELDFDECTEVRSKMDCGSCDEQPFSASSLKRELQFLLSHTVHHFAIISMILRHQGIEAPSNFGVAPSTIKFRASTERPDEAAESCAR